jgi:hypothetical protein
MARIMNPMDSRTKDERKSGGQTPAAYTIINQESERSVNDATERPPEIEGSSGLGSS